MMDGRKEKNLQLPRYYTLPQILNNFKADFNNINKKCLVEGQSNLYINSLLAKKKTKGKFRF